MYVSPVEALSWIIQYLRKMIKFNMQEDVELQFFNETEIIKEFNKKLE